MNLADMLSAPWAITPEVFATVQAVADRHLAGEWLTDAEIAAKLGGPPGSTRQPMTIERGGVAIIRVEGVLSPKMNLVSQVSGGTSYQLIGDQFDAAIADPDVRSICLLVDSPGGSINALQSLGERIFAGRSQKEIVAWTDGAMCSAALWLGSAAHRVIIGGDTTAVGSVGVLATHTDSSGLDAQRGLRRTLIASTPQKLHGQSGAPLTPAGAEAIAGQVMHLHSVFVKTIARNRGLRGDRLAAATDGSVYMGESAISMGLADSVATLDGVLAMLADSAPQTAMAHAPPTNAGDIQLQAQRLQARELAAGRRLDIVAAIGRVCAEDR